MLDLSDNDVKDRGMHTLKEALISNRSITQLSLASVGITCEGMDQPLPHVNTSAFTSSNSCLAFGAHFRCCGIGRVPG